jgi:hypothetical protein
MCSGCSGDYAGGFDFDDADEPMDGAEDGASSASCRGASETDLGENDLGETDLAESTGGGPAGLEVPEDAWESCEILVTGTQIVEIRVISANAQGKDRSSDPSNHRSNHRSSDRSGDRSGKAPPALAPHTPSKQSSGASAKYYQTRLDGEETRRQAPSSVRTSRSFARACNAKLKVWIERTRRWVRRSTARAT